MAYQTWIADAARDFGLPVEEYGGWTDRGSSSFDPGGVICHWTAGPCNATGRPSLNTVVNGRSDLPGPLANVYLDRQGVCVIVAAGRANHAGDGGYRGLSGNSSVLGIEAECCNAGDWTVAQHQNYPVLCAALVAGIGRDATWVARHCDWTSRKIDINDWPLEQLQADTAAALAGGGTGGFLMALTDAQQEELLNRVRALHVGNWVSTDGQGSLDWFQWQINGSGIPFQLTQLLDEEDWPNHPAYRASIANVVREVLAEEGLTKKPPKDKGG